VGPTPKCRFKPTSTMGLEIRPGASGSERRVILDQTRHSGTNRTIRIFIRACLPKILTKVNRWPNFELKMLKAVQTSAENPGTQVNHAPSINRPFRSYWNCQNSDPRPFSCILARNSYFKLLRPSNTEHCKESKRTTRQPSYWRQQVINDLGSL